MTYICFQNLMAEPPSPFWAENPVSRATELRSERVEQIIQQIRYYNLFHLAQAKSVSRNVVQSVCDSHFPRLLIGQDISKFITNISDFITNVFNFLLLYHTVDNPGDSS